MQYEQFFTKKYETNGIKLNDVQKQAVVKVNGPLLLLASPGSGKTTTVIMRIGYMIEQLGIHPSRIKAVTFSKASAKDMQERFYQWFPYLDSVDFSTIHSLAFQIVREYFKTNGLSFGIIEDGGSAQFVSKKHVLRQIFEQFNKTQITEDQLDELVTYISFVKNRMLPESEWQLKQYKVPKKVEIFKAYEQYKQSGTTQMLIDFDDMLIIAHDVLNNDPHVLARYQQRYDYVLTDESQDTSLIQHAIIERLVAAHQNLCIVADEDQSIYSWRGADPQYLLDFKNVYPTGEVLMMTENYRSSKNIVQAANEFIKQNKNRYDKQMETPNPIKDDIQFVELSNYLFQPNFVVTKAKEHFQHKTMAILYRNNFSAIPMMDEFDRECIPFVMKDSTIRFFSHWVVEDVLNFMRFSYNICNVQLFDKIARKMQAYITKKQLEMLAQLSGDEDVFTKLLTLPQLKDYQKNLLRKFRKTFLSIHFDETSPSEMIEFIRDDFGYDRVLKKMSEQFGFNESALFDILNVLAMIAERTTTMREFANRLKQLEYLAKNSYEKKPNAVTFSTLHSAKGLEFDEVFIIDTVEGILPTVNMKEDPVAYEEEVRLFYVGMTRAKQNLTIVSYKKRGKMDVNCSIFIPQLKRIVQPATKASPQKLRKSHSLSDRTIQTANTLSIGDLVEHVALGLGEITDLCGDSIEIRFEKDHKRKKFVLDICLQHGYLQYVNT